MTASVIVPLAPPRECSPNYHGHWRAKAKAVKALRTAAYWYGYQARPSKPFTGPVVLRARIGWPKGRRYQDTSNAAASLKGLLDGLQDAAWFLDDRDVTVLVVEQLTWGQFGKATQGLYPAGYVDCTVDTP